MKSIFAFWFSALAAASAQTESHIQGSLRYAHTATSGWIDLRAGQSGEHGVRIGPSACTGYAWSPTCGWINFGSGRPANGVRYSNTASSDFGVNREDNGKLRGLAWSATAGWINFESTGDPRIETIGQNIQLLGKIWSPALGWIVLDSDYSTILLIDTDTDKDQIPDVWEHIYSGNLALLGNGDADHDGFSDKEEYAADTDPMDPSSNLKISLFNPNNVLGILIGWTGSAARSYRIETSTDLQSWSPASLSGNAPAIGISGESGATSRFLIKPAGGRNFFRVSALVPAAGELKP